MYAFKAQEKWNNRVIIMISENIASSSDACIFKISFNKRQFLWSRNKSILTDLNYATLTSPYIFQKTVECKLPLTL